MNRRPLYFLLLVSQVAWAEPNAPPEYLGKFVPNGLAVTPVVRLSRTELGLTEHTAGLTVKSGRGRLSLDLFELPVPVKEPSGVMDPNSPAMRAQYEAAQNYVLPKVGGVRLRPRGLRALRAQLDLPDGERYQLEIRKTALGKRLMFEYHLPF